MVALDPDAARFAPLLVAATPDVGGAVLDAAEARALMARGSVPASSAPRLPEVRDRVLRSPGRTPVRVRTYRPDEPGGTADPLPVAVYLHGGGWVFGDLDSHDGVARRLCAGAGCVVVSVDYRLAPEHPFPAAFDDAVTALEWVAAHAAELGADPARLAVVGDSAGANLAAGAVASGSAPDVAVQVLLYPVTAHDPGTASYRDPTAHVNLTPAQLAWYWDQYVPDSALRDDPRVSPLRGRMRPDLPSALVVTAECDPLRDEGRAHAAALDAAGVPVRHWEAAGTFHGFFRYPDHLPVAAELIARTNAFLADALRG
ncbi:alpha/beta hydrolase [Saccharopolyspora sp. NPDC047091]|uniref:alpha/beta hydrolase n=1 Tax=Saccharopolyspora sp. NPDC047091 TaxID=3155924 RepID=UPI0033EF7996